MNTKLAMEIMAMRPGGDYGDIELFMDCAEGFYVLSQALYSRAKCKETGNILKQVLDRGKQELNCPPVKVAEQLDEADKDQIMSEDIFWFMEKAYYDAANCIDDKYWFSLASLYYYDRYGHVDFAKAVEYLEKAVETGDGRAEVLLGKCYLNGEGVPQDYEKAFHLLVKGALLDFSGEAIYLLGDMYLNGWYVKQDKPQAYQMYLRTMNILDYRDLMCADVYLRLAAYELNEIKKRSSIKKALRYYQESESMYYEQLEFHIRGAEEGLALARIGQDAARALLEEIHANQNQTEQQKENK